MNCSFAAFDRNSEQAFEGRAHALVEELSRIRDLHSEEIFRSIFRVELVVRRSGTHRTLAPDISPIARPIKRLYFLSNVRSTSRSGLTLSKHPPENTRQVSVFISEWRELI